MTTETTESPQAIDIYAVLGVHSNANATLAREMYWSKMTPVLAGTAGASMNETSIDTLNEALAIILDNDRRAAYDAARAVEANGHAPASDSTPPKAAARRFGRSAPIAAMIAVGAVSTSLTWMSAGWGAALAPVTLCAIFVTLLLRTTHAAARPHAFELLHLRPGADPEQIDMAYRVRAQQLLLLLRHHPSAMKELDALDEAYLEVMVSTFAEVPLDTPASRAVGVRAGVALAGTLIRSGGALMTMSQAALRAVAIATRAGSSTTTSGAGTVVRRSSEWLAAWSAVRRERNEAKRATHREAMIATAERVAAVQQQVAGRAASVDVSAKVFNLEQRLSGGLLTNAVQIAAARPETVIETADPVDEAALVPIFMVLESPAGSRRIPIELRPIRIGSSGDCDLVLPVREDVAPEHVLVWRHGSSLILHVTAPFMECTVNGDPVSWATLEAGDRIQIGGLQISIATNGYRATPDRPR